MNKALQFDLPELALDLRRGLITLYVRKFGKYWSPHAMAEIDDTNIDKRLNQLKSRANAGPRPQVELWLPKSEVVETTMPYKPLTYDSAAKYVAEEFGIDPDNLIIAVEKSENQFGILAMSRLAARASYEYFAGHGFQPVSLSTSAKLAYFDPAPRILFSDIFPDITIHADLEDDTDVHGQIAEDHFGSPELINDETASLETAARVFTLPNKLIENTEATETKDAEPNQGELENEADEPLETEAFEDAIDAHDEASASSHSEYAGPDTEPGADTINVATETADAPTHSEDPTSSNVNAPLEDAKPSDETMTIEDYFAAPKTNPYTQLETYSFLQLDIGGETSSAQHGYSSLEQAESASIDALGAIETETETEAEPDSETIVADIETDAETLAHQEFDAIEDTPSPVLDETSTELNDLIAARDFDAELSDFPSLTVVLTPEEQEAANAAAFGIADGTNSLDTPSRYDTLFGNTDDDESPIEAFYQEEKPEHQVETQDNIYLISDNDDDTPIAAAVVADNTGKKRMAALGFGVVALGAAAAYFGFNGGETGENVPETPEIAVLNTSNDTETAGLQDGEIAITLAPEQIPDQNLDDTLADSDVNEPQIGDEVLTETDIEPEFAGSDADLIGEEDTEVRPLDETELTDETETAADETGVDGLQEGEEVVAVLESDGNTAIREMAEITAPARRGAESDTQISEIDAEAASEPTVVAVNETDETLANKLLEILSGSDATETPSNESADIENAAPTDTEAETTNADEANTTSDEANSNSDNAETASNDSTKSETDLSEDASAETVSDMTADANEDTGSEASENDTSSDEPMTFTQSADATESDVTENTNDDADSISEASQSEAEDATSNPDDAAPDESETENPTSETALANADDVNTGDDTTEADKSELAAKAGDLLANYPLDITANDVTISESALSPKARAALEVETPATAFESNLAPKAANAPLTRPVNIAVLAETAITDAKRREREAARLAEERRQARLREEEARKAAAEEKARQDAAKKAAAQPAPKPAPKAAPKPAAKPAPAPLPKASSNSISLAGIESAGAMKYAIIRTPNGTQRVRVGQIIGGWQVTFIGSNNVILQKNGKTVQLVGK